MVTATAGEGYFLVGDAPALLDPAASHGVLKGIMSGMMSAYLLNKIVLGRLNEQEAVQEYRRWLAGWFEADVGRLRALYARLPGCAWAHTGFQPLERFNARVPNTSWLASTQTNSLP